MDSTFVKFETVGSALVARPLCEKIAEREAKVIEAEVLAQAPGHQWRVAMDCGEVMLLASVGLGMFVTVNRKCKENGGKFVAYGLSPEIVGVLKVTKLEKVIATAVGKDAAIKALM